MPFAERGLKESLTRALTQLGYENPTPIQSQAREAFKTGKSIVGQSKTGTGKTAAFLLPLLQEIDPAIKKVTAIILVPTRELAVQTQEACFDLGRYSRVRALAAYGGKSIFFQKKLLDEGMHIAVCTPGRAKDLLARGYLDGSTVTHFVLDEVDRMLDMGFIDEVEDIRDACPYVRHTMLFSATMTHEVQRMIDKRIGKEYVSLHIDSESVVVDKIDHAFIDVPHISKPDMLLRWLENHKDQKVIIFTQTKIATIELQKFLYNKGFTAGQLHGDVDQRVRLSTLKAFKNNELQVMIATDVASRGLNMNDIDLVVNFDVPQDPESYVHRIGRTARAGKEGKAITFVSDGEMKSIHAIERTNKITIKKVDADGNVVDRSMERRGGGGSRGGNSRGGRFGGGRSSGGYGGGRSSGGYQGRSSGGYESRDAAPRAAAPQDSRERFGKIFDSKEGQPRAAAPTGNAYGFTPREDFRGSRGGDRGGDRGGYQGSNDRGGSRFGGGDRAPRTGGYQGGNDRGGSRFGGTDSRGSDRGPAREPRAGDRYDDTPRKTVFNYEGGSDRPKRGNYWDKN